MNLKDTKTIKAMKLSDVKKLKNSEIVDMLEEAILTRANINKESGYGTKSFDRYIKDLKDEITRRLENNKVFRINMGLGE